MEPTIRHAFNTILFISEVTHFHGFHHIIRCFFIFIQSAKNE